MPPDITSEPDNENDEDLKNAWSSGSSRPSSPVSVPPHKPPVPDDPSTKHGMNNLLNKTASLVPQVRESSLKTDHPYGDGNHGETGSATLARLGADKKYGE